MDVQIWTSIEKEHTEGMQPMRHLIYSLITSILIVMLSEDEVSKKLLQCLLITAFGLHSLFSKRISNVAKQVPRIPVLDSDDEDIPEEYIDPITLSPIYDPAIITASGALFNYDSLFRWFATSPSRRCPKTNIELKDIEIVRIPSLKRTMNAWMLETNREVPPPTVTDQDLQALDPNLAQHVAALRSAGELRAKGLATAAINDIFIEWFHLDDNGVSEEVLNERLRVASHVLPDLLWVMRYGDDYGVGVACSALSQLTIDPKLTMFLSATAAIPAVAILTTRKNDYGRCSASRLINRIVKTNPKMAEDLCELKVIELLLEIVNLEEDFAYARAYASQALATIIENFPEAAAVARKADALRIFKGVLLNDERQSLDDRFEKRDASTALLVLNIDEAEVQPLTLETLHRFADCSDEWLLGTADEP